MENFGTEGTSHTNIKHSPYKHFYCKKIPHFLYGIDGCGAIGEMSNLIKQFTIAT
jgi:hypothetical protein